MTSDARTVLLLDTNVWLDNYLPDRPGSTAARSLISSAITHGAVLAYPATIAKDVFYLLERSAKRAIRETTGTVSTEDATAARAYAWGCLDNMRELATAVGIDEPDIWLAGKYRQFNSDFEDNLVLAAAERIHADYLVTSDEQLMRHASIAALAPKHMTDLLTLKSTAG
ncbi:MAG: PIN domain-containing protein [Coriobacteriaceae bacterium]|nr:PIN domain-containing protein [Coriobacteriaceae bacterium]